MPAYANLRANALLTLAGAPGRTTEVLSGSYFDSLSGSSPHQIWSSAMVVSPILRGMMGLEPDALSHTLAFTPHVPASWHRFKLKNVWIGKTRCDLTYMRTANQILLALNAVGGELNLHFEPAVALRARVLSVTVDGRSTKYRITTNGEDQHIHIEVTTRAHATVSIRLQRDFEIEAPWSLPGPGQKSRGVRVVATSWAKDHDRLELQMFGLEGSSYDLALRGSEQISRVDGGTLIENAAASRLLRVQFPGNGHADFLRKTVVIRFTR